MELIEGNTLARKLAGVPQPVSQAIAMTITLADAVQSAHQAGIVHRDLKPANILLTVEGTPKISDFGLAWRIEGADELTLAGTPIGTPSYMAPEQATARAGTVGPATDVYALGAVLYEMLTGRPPFKGESAAETQRQLLADDPVPPSKLNPRVARDLQTICMKCLQKDPRRRYASAAALADDLRRLQRGEPISARRTRAVERLAKWARRHPAVTTGLFSAFLFVVAVVAAACWAISQRTANNKVVEEQLREVVRFQQQSAWKDADAALDRAALRLGSNGPAELNARLNGAFRDSELASRLDKISLDHAGSVGGVLNMARADAAYQQVFREFGIGTDAESPQTVAARIKSSSIRAALVAALYDWSLQPGASGRKWLQDVITLSDNERAGWRSTIRDPAMWNDVNALATFVASASLEDESVPFLLSVREQLKKGRKDPTAFLKRVQFAHPQDFWANMALGDVLREQGKANEAIQFYQAAIAIRAFASLAHNNLGMALVSAGRRREAIPEFKRGLKNDPTAFPCTANLALALANEREFAEAIPMLIQCVTKVPADGQFRCYLGMCYEETGSPEEAMAQYLKSIELNPTYPLAYKKQRILLVKLGKIEDALALWKKQLKATPDDTNIWEGYPEFCIHLKHNDDYESARAQQLAIFAASHEPIVCERVGRTCIIKPAPPEMLQKATALIESAVAKSRNSNLEPYFLFSKGLAEYRNGSFETAIDTMNGKASLTYKPAPALVQAMAEFQLGHADLARTLYTRAIASYDWNKADSNDHQFWMYEQLRDEAAALINPAK